MGNGFYYKYLITIVNLIIPGIWDAFSSKALIFEGPKEFNRVFFVSDKSFANFGIKNPPLIL